jgi:hypothetical protein
MLVEDKTTSRTKPTRKKPVALTLPPSRYLKANCFFSLYVGGAVLRQPQDSKRRQLQLGIALFFFARYGVATGFSPHPQHGAMHKQLRCGCGSMQRLFISPQELANSN